MAKAMGYQRNLSASLLGSHRKTASRQTSVAILRTPDRENPNFQYPNESHTQAIREAAKELGFFVEEHIVTETRKLRAALRVMRARGIEGIITGFMGVLSPQWSQAEEWSEFAVVSCGRIHGDTGVDKVRPDIFGGLTTVWQRMRDLGYRRIAPVICMHKDHVEDDWERLGAVLACQSKDGGQAAALPPWLGQVDDAKILDYIREQKPDAILSFSRNLYFDLLREGYRIPEDLGLACLHSHQISEEEGFLSGCRHDEYTIGRMTMNMLEESIRSRRFGLRRKPHDRVIPALFEKGFTLRKTAP